MPRLIIALGLIGLVGCASGPHLALQSTPPAESVVMIPAKGPGLLESRRRGSLTTSTLKNAVQTVAHNEVVQSVDANEQATTGLLTIDGRQYQLQLVEPKTPNARVATARNSLAVFRNDNGVSTPVQDITTMELPL